MKILRNVIYASYVSLFSTGAFASLGSPLIEQGLAAATNCGDATPPASISVQQAVQNPSSPQVPSATNFYYSCAVPTGDNATENLTWISTKTGSMQVSCTGKFSYNITPPKTSVVCTKPYSVGASYYAYGNGTQVVGGSGQLTISQIHATRSTKGFSLQVTYEGNMEVKDTTQTNGSQPLTVLVTYPLSNFSLSSGCDNASAFNEAMTSSSPEVVSTTTTNVANCKIQAVNVQTAPAATQTAPAVMMD